MSTKAKFSKERLAVLRALDAAHDGWGFSYLNFRALSERTRLNRGEVRRNCRALARAGLAHFRNGLMTEDGDMYGAGYSITDPGREALKAGAPA